MTTQTLNGTSGPISRPISHAVSSDWQEYANCRTVDPELFFPTGTGGTITNAIANAKKVCGACVVRTECLNWAVDTGQYNGVWGGLDEKERVGLYRTPEQSFTRCLNAQEWIEKQMALGAHRRELARELGVDPGVLGRAVKQFEFERKALAAAAEAVNAA